MNKPDTKQLRLNVKRQDSIGQSWGFVADVRKIVINELCDYIDGHKCEIWTGVSPMQIREFVQAGEGVYRTPNAYQLAILDFIDNGPKPKTAEEIVDSTVSQFADHWDLSLQVVKALRESGHLK